MNETVALKRPGAGYDTDFHAWSLQQAELLRAGRFDLVDIENVAEEIEALAKRDRTAIKSHMAVLIAHLLKLECASDRDPRRAWRTSVRNARQEIEIILDDSPSLRRELPDLYASIWPRALKGARSELNDFGDAKAVERLDTLGSIQRPAIVSGTALDPDFFPGD